MLKVWELIFVFRTCLVLLTLRWFVHVDSISCFKEFNFEMLSFNILGFKMWLLNLCWEVLNSKVLNSLFWNFELWFMQCWYFELKVFTLRCWLLMLCRLMVEGSYQGWFLLPVCKIKTTHAFEMQQPNAEALCLCKHCELGTWMVRGPNNNLTCPTSMHIY